MFDKKYLELSAKVREITNRIENGEKGLGDILADLYHKIYIHNQDKSISLRRDE